MELCVQCYSSGYCRNLTARIVSDRELANPLFVAHVRQTANELGIEASEWLEAIYDMYCEYRGCIVDAMGREIFLDLEPFEVPFIREWCRDWACKTAKNGVRPRVRKESRERIRVLATILRARFPERAMMWGVVAANDNEPISPDDA